MFRSIRFYRAVLPVAFAALLLPGARAAQSDKAVISVGPNIHISTRQPTLPHVEPHVAVNPTDPMNLVAASMVVSNLEDPFEGIRCYTFASFDGGQSWVATDLTDKINTKLFSRNFCGDVWVAFGAGGAVYLSALIDRRKDEPRTNNLVFRSPDGGKTWLDPSYVPAGKGGPYDQGDILVDTTGGRFSGRVYFSAVHGYTLEGGSTWESISVSRSEDGGQTFSDPVPAQLGNLATNELNMVTLSEGTLVVSYSDYRTWQGGEISSYRLEGHRLWIVKSGDGGLTFSPPLFVAEVKYRQIPKIAVDNQSSAFRDRLYAVWANWNGTDYRTDGVHFTYSPDRGKMWIKPVTIDRSPREDGARSTAAIAVNKNGVVGVAWYDRRNDPENKCQDIYFTASLDGGESFLEPVKVSSEISCPDTPGNGAAAGRWPMGGEYSGLAASADGKFHAVWVDARSGVYQLYTAAITVNGKAREPRSE